MNKEEYEVSVKCTNFNELFKNNTIPFYIRNVLPKDVIKDVEDKCYFTSDTDIPVYFLEVKAQENNFYLHEYNLYEKILDYYRKRNDKFAVTPICGISDGKSEIESYLYNSGFVHCDERTLYNLGKNTEMVDLIEYLGMLYNSDIITYMHDFSEEENIVYWNGYINHKFIDYENKKWLKIYHDWLYEEKYCRIHSMSSIRKLFNEKKYFANDTYADLKLDPVLKLCKIYADIPNISIHMILNGDYNHFCIIDFGKNFMKCLEFFNVKIIDNTGIKLTILDEPEKIRKVNYE